MIYTAEQLRTIFQNKFNLNDWTQFLINYVGAQTMRQVPEQLELDPSEGKGFYLGQKTTDDHYEIGLFYIQTNTSVKNRKVGLRQIVKPYLRYMVDAALVVFDDGNNWRLSFVCDIKDESTSPKRYTFVFGESANYYNTAVSRFLKLQAEGISFISIKDAFSVEALTKQFYQELFEWYQWAVSEDAHITFPNNPATEEDDREDIDIKIIRLITRLMFVWFIKQKELVPSKIFDPNYLCTILKDFDAQSQTNGNYYNAILQNLFFATLNREIIDEKGAKRRFATAAKRDIKTLYRYAEMFKISEDDIIRLFSDVPFLNGGLFECLDKTRYIDGVEVAYNYDGFSRNDRTFPDGRYKHRAVVPNIIFFEPEKGLIPILSRYNFTIEENSPEEQQVALDPELLGKVFENLLGAYNPETKETARNQSGSFYTPREIVNYMVDESLIRFLGDTPLVRSLFNHDFYYDQSKTKEYSAIIGKLKTVKILDPACGSGAFPIGMLNRIVELLQKLNAPGRKYDLKLHIMENCIYGGDIQTIAAQITKLRFFISLICDCEKTGNAEDNYGIPNLPNLETHFVTCNSLIGLKKPREYSLFEQDVIELKKELQTVRHKHFMAKTVYQKTLLRNKDKDLREQLARMLTDDNVIASEDAKQIVAWNPYDQNGRASFFDPEWMFGIADGFDIVIGNPPYIQLQNNGGELAKLYESCGFSTFARTGDIYCLFYERGWQLLKKNGHLCYITSNKWMRAGYGEKTREFFANKTNPLLLIDFAGVKIFESATVDTNILLFSKSNNQHKTVCAVTNKQNKDSVKNLSDFVQQQNSVCDFSSSDSWVILSPIEQSIKRKIEAVGTPLKDWDIQINYGIKTGFNDAFIISTEKREEILAKCLSEDERERTAELIRPILRGRDIKRYGYEWANLWLIYIPWHFPYQFDESIQGASEKAEKAFRDQYPAVYSHMLQYKDPLSKRNKAETGIRYEWYAMQRWGAKYWEDFNKPKITWGNLNLQGTYAYAPKGMFINAPSPFIATDNIAILHILNSKIADYYIRSLGVTRNGGYFEYKPMFVDKLPIPQDGLEELMSFNEQPSEQEEKGIVSIIYRLYGFTSQEIEYIENREF